MPSTAPPCAAHEGLEVTSARATTGEYDDAAAFDQLGVTPR